MKKIYCILIFIIVIFLNSSNVYCDNLSNDNEISRYFENEMNNTDYIIAKAKIISIEYDDTMEKRDVPLESDIRYQHIKVKILNGKFKGQSLVLKHTVERIMPGNYIFKNGDKILLRITERDGNIDTVKIQEKIRDTQVFIIIGLFIALLLIFGKLSGLKTLISLFLTISLIIFAYIPLILKGFSPIISSIIISIIAIILTLIIISGFNKKTLVAVIGTSIGVIMAGILAIIFGKVSHLTGLSDDNSISLAYIPQFRNLNYQGILFGTMLIGAIGAVMDVAISIASSLFEMKLINGNISKKEMFSSGMNIGRDMLGSMSNTLILAYVGTSLHLIMLFMVYKIKFIEIMNLDSIATEIIRAMAGSIGLIITIPITVAIGVYYYVIKK